ncbi:MAG: group II intron maturase-specific domain-containing protein [Burkholderia sp.]
MPPDRKIVSKQPDPVQRLLMQMTTFLEKRLKLQINESKSACARPWTRKFLGHSLTMHRQAWLRIAPESIKWLTARVKERMRKGRGRSLSHTIEALNSVLRGWINYFRYTQTEGRWKNWTAGYVGACAASCGGKRSTANAELTTMLPSPGAHGGPRTQRSARNRQGPWWNAGASDMNAAFLKRWFDVFGLVVSLLDTRQRLQRCL